MVTNHVRTGRHMVFKETPRQRQRKAPSRHRCVGCRQLFKIGDIELAPDPYSSDVGCDDTPVWECDYCRGQSARDI